jgi:sporulation protein YlmC with PRC-barrel domain
MKSFRKEDVVGKTVIETSGAVKGKVKDLMFDLNGTITLTVEGLNGKESLVPVAMVTGISDHVVIKSEPIVGQGVKCKFCGAPLSPGVVWCPSCGKSQS